MSTAVAAPVTVATSDIVVVAKTEVDPNEVKLVVDGVVYAGWTDVQVTLIAEGFPPSFSVQASVPPDADLPFGEGVDCVVKMGNDTVITGYVDRVRDFGDSETHTIEINGRGKTQDLVDCGAEWTSHQMIGGNALIIAQRLAQPYGIEVIMVNGADPGPAIPEFLLNYGESAADIIQRVARNAGLLAYEDHLGRLCLAAAGSAEASSGFVYGTNVQAWSVERSMDQRFSDYVVASVSTASMGALDAQGGTPGKDYYVAVKDPVVPRHRLKYLVVDYMAQDPENFTQKRAQWKCRGGQGDPSWYPPRSTHGGIRLEPSGDQTP
jgi:prophage tail gpP-like protein